MATNVRRFAMAAAVGLGLMAPMHQVLADSDSDTYRNLSAEWWQWALSIPPSESPLADTTGEKCMVGQHGSVWFLAATFGSGGPTVRSCAVPKGKALFFPVVNFVNIDTPGVCGQTASKSIEKLRAEAAENIDGATKLSAEVDGRPIRSLRRVKSKVFSVALPEENLFDAPCGAPEVNVPAGVFAPAVDDGYYVRLKPLKAGTHKVHFHAERPKQKPEEQDFLLDVTYNLTVVPGMVDTDDEEDD